MAHFAIVCPPISGHLDPMAAFGRSLQARGHRVSVFHVRDLEQKVQANGLEFIALDSPQFPVGTLSASVKKIAALKGSASLKFAVECACAISRAMLRDGPALLREAGVDGLLVDQNEPAGGTIAEKLGIPFVSVCTSLPLNREPSIPPPFQSWGYSASLMARLRNRAGYAIADQFIAPIDEENNRYRRQWGLRPLNGPDSSFSKLAQIAQMPREFDFPRCELPENFHYLGPLFDGMLGKHVAFPFEKLDGRPIVYGSIGTLQQDNSPLFRVMAEACMNLDAQLVLSLGNPETRRTWDLPGNPIVVNYAPQIELLRRASVTITHAGMNTTQQSLYFGVPMVAVPLAHDQPAIAARLARTGAGVVMQHGSLSVERLREALQLLLPVNSSFRARAQSLGEASRSAGGVRAAADIAERILQ